MPINVNLLIAAPMLQDLLVDKTGIPMASGTITCYQDNSRTTLKNWYYQSGTPGNYTYITLPNPLTLSAAGTICDVNGVDTIPFFYPYSELDSSVKQPYYITIVNFAQTNQITRANFPFNPSGGGSGTTVNTFTNLITNNSFWRNIAPNTVNVANTGVALNNILTQNSSGAPFNTVVAPSQHDGFRYPDVQFFKNNLTATDTVTFVPFPLTNTAPISNSNVPEYYLSHDSTANGSSGETYKYYQFPIALHVNSLSNVPFTVSIEAQNSGGTSTGQNVITLSILQDTGTGTTSPAPLVAGSITLNTAWTVYSFTGIFPGTAGLTLGQGADDALYLQVGLPLNTASTINFTKPSIYLTNGVIPNYSFETYDQANSTFNSARTGDLRITTNPFYNATTAWVYGWVPMNDGVIGLNAESVVSTVTLPGYTRGNTDTWPLYNLLWQLAKPFDSGSNSNPICQLYTNNGTILTATNYNSGTGATGAYADFIANNAIQLTKMFGRALMGTIPMQALFANYKFQSVGINSVDTGTNTFTPTNISGFWQGAAIYFEFSDSGSLPAPLVSNAIYYVTNISGSTFQVATTYANAIAGSPVVDITTTGLDVFVNFLYTGSTLGEYSHTQLAAEVGAHTHGLTGQTGTSFLNGLTGGGSSFLTNSPGASVTNANSNGSPFNIVQPGSFYNILIKL